MSLCASAGSALSAFLAHGNTRGLEASPLEASPCSPRHSSLSRFVPSGPCLHLCSRVKYLVTASLWACLSCSRQSGRPHRDTQVGLFPVWFFPGTVFFSRFQSVGVPFVLIPAGLFLRTPADPLSVLLVPVVGSGGFIWFSTAGCW